MRLTDNAAPAALGCAIDDADLTRRWCQSGSIPLSEWQRIPYVVYFADTELRALPR